MIPLHRLLFSWSVLFSSVSSVSPVLCNEALLPVSQADSDNYQQSEVDCRAADSYTTKTPFMGLECPFLLRTCHVKQAHICVDVFVFP